MATFSFRKQQSVLARSTNSEIRTGLILLRLFAVVWLILTVVPIFTTIVGVRESIAADPSAQGAGGAVVFAMLFVAPVQALMIAGWLVVPALIFMIVGAVRAKWGIRRLEWVYLLLSIAVVLVAVKSIPLLGEILPMYFAW